MYNDARLLDAYFHLGRPPDSKLNIHSRIAWRLVRSFSYMIKLQTASNALSVLSARDKWSLLFVVAFYVFIAVAVSSLGWVDGWSLIYVDTMTPPLADLRTVQGALISLESGVDPYLENPGDPWGRTVNYPAIWLFIAKIFALDVEANFIAFVSTYIAIFLGGVAYLLYRFPSWGLALVAISGAVLMGIERGNNDLLIFSIVLTALVTSNRGMRVGLIICASILKLYPIAAGVALFSRFENSKALLWRVRYALIASVSFLFYFVIFFNELILGVGNTHTAGAMSYGSGVLAFLSNERLPSLPMSLAMINSALAASIALMFMFRERIATMIGITDRGISTDTLRESMFLVGALIYVITFFAGSSWDYRMVYCILTVPYALSIGNARFRLIYMAIILMALNQFLLVGVLGTIGGVVNIAGKTALMMVLSSVLVIRLPSLLLPKWLGGPQEQA